MNPAQSKTTRYAPIALCGLALLLVIAWLALRESPPPSDLPPLRSVTVSPRIPLIAPDNVAPLETSTNPVAESPAIPTNAATIYRQAFTLYDALSKDQKDLLKDWRTNVDAAVAAELCEKLEPICDRMHQAAAATNCIWGVEQTMTFSTLLPHLGLSRNLTRAALWSVAHCRTDNSSAAIDDLVASSRLGQNVSSSALIGHLVDLSIQGMVIDSTTEHARMLVGADDTRLMKLLNDANYDDSLRRAYRQEGDMAGREADRLAALPPEAVAGELKPLGDESSSAQIQAMGPAQAIAGIRQVAELEKQFANALGLPDAEYRDWLTSLEAVRKTNPFVDLLFTPTENVVNRTQAMTVRNAMAVAGLAVMQDGPDALPLHPDPTTGQPFVYKQTTDGFDLESSFQVAEKPLKLTFK